MIKSQKTVLKRLVKLSGNSDTDLIRLYDEEQYLICTLCNEENYADFSDFANELESILEQLGNEGYIVRGEYDYHFHLTAKGLHHNAYTWEQIKKFLLESIVVPIFVAAITAFFTVLITG